MSLSVLFCVLGASQWINVHVYACVSIRKPRKRKKLHPAAFIEEKELKLHQHKEINQSCAVINNGVIRSLVPQ